MNLTDPDELPAPRLDPVRRAAILDDVLATAPARQRSPWLPALAAAAAVVAVAGGGYALSARDEDRPTPVAKTPATAPTKAADPVVPFTLGPLAEPARLREAARCIANSSAPGDGITVPYAQRVRGPRGTGPAVVVEQPATGAAVFCAEGSFASIAGPWSKSVVEAPTRARPVTHADGGGTSSNIRKDTISFLFTDTLLRVHPVVARVEIRVGTADDPGTWHRATPQGGYAYLGAWLDHDVPETTPLFVETRAYDAAGRPLRSDALGRERLEPFLKP